MHIGHPDQDEVKLEVTVKLEHQSPNTAPTHQIHSACEEGRVHMLCPFSLPHSVYYIRKSLFSDPFRRYPLRVFPGKAGKPYLWPKLKTPLENCVRLGLRPPAGYGPVIINGGSHVVQKLCSITRTDFIRSVFWRFTI